jgi:hypothetical protein
MIRLFAGHRNLLLMEIERIRNECLRKSRGQWLQIGRVFNATDVFQRDGAVSIRRRLDATSKIAENCTIAQVSLGCPRYEFKQERGRGFTATQDGQR